MDLFLVLELLVLDFLLEDFLLEDFVRVLRELPVDLALTGRLGVALTLAGVLGTLVDGRGFFGFRTRRIIVFAFLGIVVAVIVVTAVPEQITIRRPQFLTTDVLQKHNVDELQVEVS